MLRTTRGADPLATLAPLLARGGGWDRAPLLVAPAADEAADAVTRFGKAVSVYASKGKAVLVPDCDGAPDGRQIYLVPCGPLADAVLAAVGIAPPPRPPATTSWLLGVVLPPEPAAPAAPFVAAPSASVPVSVPEPPPPEPPPAAAAAAAVQLAPGFDEDDVMPAGTAAPQPALPSAGAATAAAPAVAWVPPAPGFEDDAAPMPVPPAPFAAPAAAVATAAEPSVLEAHDSYADDLVSWLRAQKGRLCDIRNDVFVAMPPPCTLRKWEPSMTAPQRLTAFLAAHPTRFAISEEGTHVHLCGVAVPPPPLPPPVPAVPPMPAAAVLVHAPAAAAPLLVPQALVEADLYERWLREWLRRPIWYALSEVCAALPPPRCLEVHQVDYGGGAVVPLSPVATLRAWLAARADAFAMDTHQQRVCCVAPTGMPVCRDAFAGAWRCTSCSSTNPPGRARCFRCGWGRAAALPGSPAAMTPRGAEEQQATVAIVGAALRTLQAAPHGWLPLTMLGVSLAAGAAHLQPHAAQVLRHGTLLAFLRAHPSDFQLFDRSLEWQFKVRCALATPAPLAPVAASARHHGGCGAAAGGGVRQPPPTHNNKRGRELLDDCTR